MSALQTLASKMSVSAYCLVSTFVKVHFYEQINFCYVHASAYNNDNNQSISRAQNRVRREFSKRFHIEYQTVLSDSTSNTKVFCHIKGFQWESLHY